MNTQTHDPRLELLLRSARNDAGRETVRSALWYLNEAREYAAKVGIEVPEATLKEVEETAYRNGVEAELGYARDEAGKGAVCLVLGRLKNARKYAAKAGVEVPEATSQEIEKTAYSNGIETELYYARAYADRVGVNYTLENTLGHLENARKYAAKVGIEVPEATLQEIEKTAYRNGIETALGNARDYAGRGNVDYALAYFNEARKYAVKVGIEVPEATLQEIEAGLKK